MASPLLAYRVNLARPCARHEPRYDYRHHVSDSIVHLVKANAHRRRRVDRWIKKQGLTNTITVHEYHDKQSYFVAFAPASTIKILARCPHVGEISPIVEALA
jgi:hypothetical protein